MFLVSSSILGTMSDSDSSVSNSINGESKTPIVETRNGHGGLVTSIKDRRKDDDDDDKSEGVAQIVELKLHSLGEAVLDEENDGFHTPTSMDHKIPLSKKCPPAPRKLKSCPMKKIKSSSNSIRIRLDFSKEIQAMFPDLGHKIKKPRSI